MDLRGDYLLIAILVGLSPLLIVLARRAWRWYYKFSSSSNTSLQERVKRIEEGGEE